MDYIVQFEMDLYIIDGKYLQSVYPDVKNEIDRVSANAHEIPTFWPDADDGIADTMHALADLAADNPDQSPLKKFRGCVFKRKTCWISIKN